MLRKHSNLDIIKLRFLILKKLRFRHMKFKELCSVLRVKNINFLDSALQGLRKSGQIYYAGHKKGWIFGRGNIYKPNQRRKT